MGNLFGRKKQSRVTEQDRAILVRGLRRAGAGPCGGNRGGKRSGPRFRCHGAPSCGLLDRPRLGPERPGLCLGAERRSVREGARKEACGLGLGTPSHKLFKVPRKSPQIKIPWAWLSLKVSA